MPLLCGPLNSRFTYTGSPCPHLDLALPSAAKTLGEAIAHYANHFAVEISAMTTPLDGKPENLGKFFECRQPATGMYWVLDIHVLRGNEELCPKQDLLFGLHAQDIVELGALVC
jgi:hypothetical protein